MRHGVISSHHWLCFCSSAVPSWGGRSISVLIGGGLLLGEIMLALSLTLHTAPLGRCSNKSLRRSLLDPSKPTSSSYSGHPDVFWTQKQDLNSTAALSSLALRGIESQNGLAYVTVPSLCCSPHSCNILQKYFQELGFCFLFFASRPLFLLWLIARQISYCEATLHEAKIFHYWRNAI